MVSSQDITMIGRILHGPWTVKEVASSQRIGTLIRSVLAFVLLIASSYFFVFSWCAVDSGGVEHEQSSALDRTFPLGGCP
jgi:hypothetical protein